jgi:tetratricopeptide (TPR) repeat protein
VKLVRVSALFLTVGSIGGICSLDSTALAQNLQSTQAEFARGQALVTAKKPGEAAERFEAVTKAEPDFAPGWYALAAARRKAGQCDRAIDAYKKYAQMLPDEPEPHYGLGLCLRETGQLASAAQALRRYVELEKRESSQKWVDHARGVIEEIGSAADAPRGTSPGPAPATPPPAAKTPTDSPAAPVYAAAQQLRDTGHIEDAIVKFKEAIAIDPAHMAARAALGELLIKIRRDDEAITVFRAAVLKSPDYPLAWYELAFALRLKNRMPEAIEAYERYIKLRPSDPDPYYGLARALQKLGKKDEALRAYQTYVTMEKRPAEQRWVDAAQTEIRALGAP